MQQRSGSIRGRTQYQLSDLASLVLGLVAVNQKLNIGTATPQQSRSMSSGKQQQLK
jgi:hypothetical protein